jgi:hypothetical protein
MIHNTFPEVRKGTRSGENLTMRMADAALLIIGTKLEHSGPGCYMWITGDRKRLQDRRTYRVGLKRVWRSVIVASN